MKTKYHKSLKYGDCFGRALADLLVSPAYDDENSARLVMRKYYSNPPLLCKWGGTSIGTVTRLVSELTDGNYTGTLYSDVGRECTVLASVWGFELVEKINNILREEHDAGRVRPLEELASIPAPSILLIPGHAAAYLGEDMIVDDGSVEHIPLESLDIEGVLIVQSTRKHSKEK